MASTKDEILDRLVAEQQQDEKATADAVARREASRAAADAATAAARKRIESTYARYLETVAALSAHADAFLAELMQVHTLAHELRTDAAILGQHPLDLNTLPLDGRLSRYFSDALRRLNYRGGWGGIELSSSIADHNAIEAWRVSEDRTLSAAMAELISGEPVPARVKHRSTPQPRGETPIKTTFKFDH